MHLDHHLTTHLYTNLGHNILLLLVVPTLRPDRNLQSLEFLEFCQRRNVPQEDVGFVTNAPDGHAHMLDEVWAGARNVGLDVCDVGEGEGVEFVGKDLRV